MAFTLYGTKSSCAVSSFIAAKIVGLDFNYIIVDLATHKTTSGDDYYAVNPKGGVPSLVLKDGTTITENSAVLQWIGDQDNSVGIVPAPKTPERYRLISQLNYIASEIHPAIGQNFYPPENDQVNDYKLKKAAKYLNFLESTYLPEEGFLSGTDTPYAADLYLWIILTWLNYLPAITAAVPLDSIKKVIAYRERVGSHPDVKRYYEELQKLN